MLTIQTLDKLAERASDVAGILNAALLSVDPRSAAKQALQKLLNEDIFSNYERVGLVSIGKAAIPMAQAANELLGNGIESGIIITKVLSVEGDSFPQKYRLYNGNHPVPGKKSAFAGKQIIEYLEGFRNGDVVLFLISGGASALVTHPVKEIDLEDLMAVTKLLLDCGASIGEINAVRKHLDNCKGGGLAETAYPAPSISLILSDVPGNHLDVIASGPTVPDPTTFADAMNIFVKYDQVDAVPKSIYSYLSDGMQGKNKDTPKPGNEIFLENRTEIIGSLEQAMDAARLQAEKLGFTAEFYRPLLSGEASDIGRQLADFLKKQADNSLPGKKPRCWICGGETTVTIKGSGAGGRNQELALAAVSGLADVPGAVLVTFATDGEDGQSPAAGAVVTSNTLHQARQKGLDPADFLARNDSFNFFSAVNASIITGSTGTNVNDLVILMLE